MTTSLTKTLIHCGVIIAALGYGTIIANYADVSGFGKDQQSGRTKNSIATVVAGVVGQKMYGNSDIDVEIQKTMWPDARVTGATTPTSIDTYTDLALTHVHFTASANDNGKLEGNVDKSDFDWKVEQTSDSTYKIIRFKPKWNAELDIKVLDGKIKGTYVRSGLNLDWDIEGTYDANGHINCEIDGPLSLGVTLDGTITQK
jgi:hypothetical protein